MNSRNSSDLGSSSTSHSTSMSTVYQLEECADAGVEGATNWRGAR